MKYKQTTPTSWQSLNSYFSGPIWRTLILPLGSLMVGKDKYDNRIGKLKIALAYFAKYDSTKFKTLWSHWFSNRIWNFNQLSHCCEVFFLQVLVVCKLFWQSSVANKITNWTAKMAVTSLFRSTDMAEWRCSGESPW